jgi:hypothetical protein
VTSGEPSNHVKRAACRCGPPPEACVPDGAVITQHGWKPSPFRNQPRPERELGLSVLQGKLSVLEATRYVLQGEMPTDRQLLKARVRRTTGEMLRTAGFALVHTPGRLRRGVHCTVVWPDSDPLEAAGIPWPSEVSALFDSCFNEEGEVEPDES